MDAVVAILAGGFGTRLGDLTRDVPKPMLPFGGKPYLQRIVESFARRGFARFVLLTGHMHEVVEQHFGDGARLGVAIRYSRETEPLGTGGAVRDAAPLLGARFVLTYGDVLREFGYDRFVERHDRNCLAVYQHEPGMSTRGNVAVSEGRVSAFVKDGDLPFVDAGFAVIDSEALMLLPAHGACSFEQVVYPALAAAGKLDAEIIDHEFCDIGNPAELERTRRILEGS